MKHPRLDRYLVDAGLVESRTLALGLILAGRVYVDGVKADKAGMPVKGSPAIEIRGQKRRFVSRAGEKLDHAIEAFGVAVEGKNCLDVGQSTGGFTDCLLKRGAARVTGVDVGYGQIDLALRNDPRVTVRERCNFRHMTASDFPAPFDLFVMDASFISATLLLPVARELLVDGGFGIVLVKPQFEAGRDEVSRGGIVRDGRVHAAVLAKVFAACYNMALGVEQATHSPLPGKDGNLEYLALVRREPVPRPEPERETGRAAPDPSVIVARAFAEFADAGRANRT